MRRSLLVVTIAIVAFTAACSSAPTSPTKNLKANDGANLSGFTVGNG